MNQDEAVSREDQHPLEQAVEKQGQALKRVADALPQEEFDERKLRQATEEAQRSAETVKRELGRQDTGTLPKSPEGEPPQPPAQEPIGGLG
ncbi:MAG: hypothetical protein JO069_03850 [Verrucomicrobia bacterium]|nr:hypothetical protein [Verrucomicrobiota bacterium]